MKKSSSPRVLSRGTAHVDQPFEQVIWDNEAEDFQDAINKNVERYAIDYTHKSGCDVVHDRLPNQSDLQGMDLAFRERPLPGGILRRYTQQWMFSIMAGVLLAGFVLGVILPLMRVGVIAVLPASIVIGIFAAFVLMIRRFKFSTIVKVLYVPPLVVTAIAVVGWLMVLRIPFLFIMVGVALWSLKNHGEAIFTFYEEWLLTEPNIRPEARNRHERQRAFSPSVVLAGIVLCEATIVGFFSHTIALAIASAILIVVFMCQAIWLSQNVSYRRFYRHVMSVMSQYLTYGVQTSGAPGIWRPSQSVTQRRRNLLILLATSVLALTYALDGFMGAEFFYELQFKLRIHRGATDGFFDRAFGLRSPMGWVFFVIEAAADRRETALLLTFPIALLISMILCPLFFLTTFGFPMYRSMKLYEFVGKAVTKEKRPEWQWYVDRMRSSSHVTRDPVTGQANHESEHLFLGVEPVAHHPVLLDKRILSEHAYILGESGSGKTSMGVMPLLLQLIRGDTPGASAPNEFGRGKIQVAETCQSCGATMKVWGPARRQTFQCPKCRSSLEIDFAKHARRNPADPPPPMVIIDLKGDPALFHTVREEAEARSPGSFRWFTPEQGFSSHVFNPFEDFATAERSVQQVCELFLESLGLAHGDGYGRSYFTRQNRVALLEALRSEPAPRSFQDLMHRLVELERLRPDDFSDIAELTSTIRVLMEYPQLALRHQLVKPEQAIHMPAVLEHRQVVYFWLPAALESVSVREIAKLALYSFLSAAVTRQRSGWEVRQSYLVIDEFQRIVGDNFRIVLEQARSFGIGAILANQSRSDLVTPTTDLRPTVNTNTRLKMMFSLSDPNEIADLKNVSGEEMIEFLSTSTSVTTNDRGGSGTSVSVTAQNAIQPRLSTNEILSISDHPLDFIMQVSRSSGYTQYGGLPVRVRTNFPISAELYQHRTKRAAWPELEPYELKEGAGKLVTTSPAELEAERESFAADFEELLEKEFARQQERFTE